MEINLGKTVGLFSVVFGALSGPALLFFPEKVLPCPILLEEGYKLIMVLTMRRWAQGEMVKWAALVGLLFAMSETVLFWGGTFGQEWTRLLAKGVLALAVHGGTSVLYAQVFSRGWFAVGLGLGLGWAFHRLANLCGF